MALACRDRSKGGLHVAHVLTMTAARSSACSSYCRLAPFVLHVCARWPHGGRGHTCQPLVRGGAPGPHKSSSSPAQNWQPRSIRAESCLRHARLRTRRTSPHVLSRHLQPQRPPPPAAQWPPCAAPKPCRPPAERCRMAACNNVRECARPIARRRTIATYCGYVAVSTLAFDPTARSALAAVPVTIRRAAAASQTHKMRACRSCRGN